MKNSCLYIVLICALLSCNRSDDEDVQPTNQCVAESYYPTTKGSKWDYKPVRTSDLGIYSPAQHRLIRAKGDTLIKGFEYQYSTRTSYVPGDPHYYESLYRESIVRWHENTLVSLIHDADILDFHRIKPVGETDLFSFCEGVGHENKQLLVAEGSYVFSGNVKMTLEEELDHFENAFHEFTDVKKYSLEYMYVDSMDSYTAKDVYWFAKDIGIVRKEYFFFKDEFYYDLFEWNVTEE